MNLFFWMLLNLGVPIVGPIFTLALVAPTHGWRVAKALIAASVKDGQLFWCAVGLCAAAVYEAVTALEIGRGGVPLLEFAIVAFCIAAFVCSNIVTLSLLNASRDQTATRIHDRQGRFATGALSHVAIVVSILITSIIAILFAILHVYVN